jgi:hypothetical protein
MVGIVIPPARRAPRVIDRPDGPDDFNDLDELDDGGRVAGALVLERVSLPRHFGALRAPREVDDDEPTELIPIVAPSEPEARPQPRRLVRRDDPVTEPLTVELPPVTAREPERELQPVSRNGFHVDAGHHFRPIADGKPVPDVLAKFGITGKGPARRNRHYREDPDDTDPLGRRPHRDS